MKIYAAQPIVVNSKQFAAGDEVATVTLEDGMELDRLVAGLISGKCSADKPVVDEGDKEVVVELKATSGGAADSQATD